MVTAGDALEKKNLSVTLRNHTFPPPWYSQEGLRTILAANAIRGQFCRMIGYDDARPAQGCRPGPFDRSPPQGGSPPPRARRGSHRRPFVPDPAVSIPPTEARL